MISEESCETEDCNNDAESSFSDQIFDQINAEINQLINQYFLPFYQVYNYKFSVHIKFIDGIMP